MMKFADFGVGMAGIVVVGVLRGLFVADALPASGRSGTDTVSIFFRLDEEKFFRRVPGPTEPLVLRRAGDPGTEGTLSSLSCVVAWCNAGMGRIVFDVVSVGSGPCRPDDPVRTPLWVATVVAGEGGVALAKVSCEREIANADFGGSMIVDVERGSAKEGGWVLGAGATDADNILGSVSIFSWVAFRPDSLRSRTPGVLNRCPGGAPLGALTGKDGVGRFGRAPEGGGCAGGGCEGGGCAGGGICFPCNSKGRDGNAGAPAGKENEVPAEVGFELIEVPHVLPEKPLESDCRGRADLDCIVSSESRT